MSRHAEGFYAGAPMRLLPGSTFTNCDRGRVERRSMEWFRDHYPSLFTNAHAPLTFDAWERPRPWKAAHARHYRRHR